MKKYPKVLPYKVENRKKYRGNADNVTSRSSWERRFFRFCDSCDEVLEWNSEEVVVPYVSVDNKIHKYYIDIYLKTNKGRFLIEIKPESQTSLREKPKRASKKYLREAYTYSVNVRKWESAQRFAEKHNTKFVILTEKSVKPTFSNKKIEEKLKGMGIL